MDQSPIIQLHQKTKPQWLWMLLLIFSWTMGLPGTSIAESGSLPTGPVLTILTPRPQQLVLDLEEVELDWSDTQDSGQQTHPQAPFAVVGTRLLEQKTARSLFALARVTNAAALLHLAQALEAANPGAKAALVLYPPDRKRTVATRRLLTREVGLIIEKDIPVTQILAAVPVYALRPVPGVLGGYVLEAADPLAALSLVETLRQRPGVRTVYSLLRRQASIR